jgi:hypothetical protein
MPELSKVSPNQEVSDTAEAVTNLSFKYKKTLSYFKPGMLKLTVTFKGTIFIGHGLL